MSTFQNVVYINVNISFNVSLNVYYQEKKVTYCFIFHQLDRIYKSCKIISYTPIQRDNLKYYMYNSKFNHIHYILLKR